MTDAGASGGVGDAIITDELARRPSRAPDHRAENEALRALIATMAGAPDHLLQQLAERALGLTRSDSAGISLLEPSGEGPVFRWAAAAGAITHVPDLAVPVAGSPGGEVLARDEVLLVEAPDRLFPALTSMQPPMCESLLAPIHIDGRPAGMLWAIKHSPEGRFQAEDARLLQSFACFASAVRRNRLAVDAAGSSSMEAARESEERFRTLAASIADVFYIIDLERDELLYVSPSYERVWGRPVAELLNEVSSFVDRIHPDDRDTFLVNKAARDRGEAVASEYRIVRPDGEMRWIFDRSFPVDTAPRRLSAGIATDITARKKAEAALRESEERYRLIVESATDYAILITDPGDIIADWLPGAQAVFGWTAAEAIGQPAGITFTPDDRAKGAPEWEVETAAREGCAPDIRWHQRKDGGRVFIEGSVTPLRHEDGSIRGFLKIGQDRSERRAAQEALEASEQRMRSLVTGIPQLVFRSNGQGERTWGSPQWIDYTGVSFEDSLGLGWLRAIHPDDREMTIAAWAGVEERGEYYCEHRVCHAAADEYRWHQTRAMPMRDEAGHILEWIGSSNDVEELRRLQRHQQMLLAELQHRVRNTLGVVRSIARRTADLSVDKDEMASHLQGRLAAFSRVQAAVTRTPTGGVELAAIVEDELLAHAARESEKLTVKGPELLLKPQPAETISLAIHELTSNAVKYGALSDGVGRLSIRWAMVEREGSRWLRFQWEENGMHLPPEPPARRGFGMELLDRTLPYELDAVTEAEFRPTGFRFTLNVPLANLVVESSGAIG